MNVLVIDAETANSVKQPLPYDVGYAIVDTETGEIFTEKSFVVAEIFLDKELMKDAYFAEKIPQYWDDIKAGKRIMKSICNIRKTIKSDMKDFIIMLKILIWFVVLLFVSTHIFTEPTNLYWLILIVIAFISTFMGTN